MSTRDKPLAATLAVVRKDLLQLRRDPAALFFAIGWPLIVAIAFGLLFGGGGQVTAPRVLLVDQDGSAQSRAFAKNVEGIDALDVERAASLDVATDAVRRGRRVAAIVLPPGWGASGGGGFSPDAMAVELRVDPSRKAEIAMLEGLLTGAAMQSLMSGGGESQSATLAQARKEVASLPPASRDAYVAFFDALEQLPDTDAGTGTGQGDSAIAPLKLATTPVQAARQGPTNSHAVTFPQGMFWALLGCLMTFATSLATERSAGTWLRLRAAPVAPWRLLAGKGLACALAMLVALNLLAVVGALGFGLRVDWLLLQLAFLAGTACFTALMMLLALMGRSVAAANGVAWAVLMPLAMVGGAMIPLFVMPGWMQQVALASPVRWFIVAVEGATWRGFGIAEMLPACAVLVGIAAALLVLVRLRARTALA